MNFTLKNRLRFLPETVIVSIIAVPLILTEKSTHFMYNHTCRMGNGSGSRRRLLNSVQAALKSPFSKSIHTAIPPPAALCNIKKCLLLFLNGFSCLVMGIIVRKGLFVKKNNKKSLETCRLRRTERKMVISKKNITFQKLP